MESTKLFTALNAAALAGWLVLLLAPRGWRWLGLVPRFAVPGAIAAVYTALVGAHLAAALAAGGGFGSIAEVRALFASDPLLVAGWGHYLAFDLLVGVWLADRMDGAAIPRWLQAPVLLLTFLLGPVGWLLGSLMLAGLAWRGGGGGLPGPAAGSTASATPTTPRN
jgi:hypothetical protein